MLKIFHIFEGSMEMQTYIRVSTQGESLDITNSSPLESNHSNASNQDKSILLIIYNVQSKLYPYIYIPEKVCLFVRH